MSQNAITATRIPQRSRMKFFPRAFSRFYLRAESYIFNWTKHYSPNYQGGVWDYYQTSNGAYFVTPPDDLYLTLPNHVEGEFSQFQAGIIVTLATYSYLAAVAHEIGNETLQEFIVSHYWLLRDYVDALDTEVRTLIQRAID